MSKGTKTAKRRKLTNTDLAIKDFFKFSKQFLDHPERLEAFPELTVFTAHDSRLYKLLTPKRLELARFIRENKDKKLSIGEIAQKLGRKQEAISRDLKILVEAGLVEMHYIGKEHFPVATKAYLVVAI